jgi:hypothetical protein
VAALQAAGVGLSPLFAALGALSLIEALYVLRAWGPQGLRLPAAKA